MRSVLTALVVASTVLALVGAPAVSAGATVNDPYEPNDSQSDATEIEAGDYSDLTLRGQESDFYAVELSGGETLDVRLQRDQDAPVNPAVTVYDSDGTALDTAVEFTYDANDTVVERVAHQVDESGTYYVEVHGGREDAELRYSLAVAIASNDRYEANGQRDSATPLEPGTYDDLSILGGESDFYAVEMTEGETMDVAVEHGQTIQRPGLIVHGPGGSAAATGTEYWNDAGDVRTVRAAFQARQSGTYYIEVVGDQAIEQASPYSLSITVADNDRFEPNGLTSGATQLEPGTYDDLAVLSGESDFFAVEMTEGETMDLAVEQGQVINQAQLAVYGPDGNLYHDGTEYTDDASNTRTLRAAFQAHETGTFYVEVSGNGMTELASPYSLSLAVADNDRFEPNGRFEGAARIEPGTYEDLSVLATEDDYFAVEVPEGATLDASIQRESDTVNDPRLVVYDPNANALATASESEDPSTGTVTERATVEASSGGTYYLAVSGDTYGERSVAYSLDVGVTESSTPTPTATPEPTATATPTVTPTPDPTATPEPTDTPTATPAPETATPEPQTATPEPDTETPEPRTETPRPDTETPAPDTPEPQTETPEPETPAPQTETEATQTPTPPRDDEDTGPVTTSGSGPGMGVIVALVGLLAGALVAARRP